MTGLRYPIGPETLDTPVGESIRILGEAPARLRDAVRGLDEGQLDAQGGTRATTRMVQRGNPRVTRSSVPLQCDGFASRGLLNRPEGWTVRQTWRTAT
jgi:hypothetical protein